LKPTSLLKSVTDAANQGKASQRSRWIGWLSLLLAAIFLYLALRGVDWRAFLAVLQNVNYLLLPVALVWGSLTYLVRAARWRALLAAEKKIPVLEVFWANMAGYLGNAVLPARAGELIRAGYLRRTTGMSFSFVFATGLVERLVDLVTLIILGSTSLALAGALSVPMRLALTSVAMMAAIGLLGILLLPFFGGRLERLVQALPFLRATWKEKLAGFLAQFLIGLRAIVHLRRASLFLLLTAAIWLMDGLGAMLIGRLLHLPLSLAQAFVLISALGLSSAIPSTPGYVGVYQLAAKAVLVPFGFSAAAALAFILVVQALGLIVVGTWGGIALWRFSRALLRAAPDPDPSPAKDLV